MTESSGGKDRERPPASGWDATSSSGQGGPAVNQGGPAVNQGGPAGDSGEQLTSGADEPARSRSAVSSTNCAVAQSFRQRKPAVVVAGLLLMLVLMLLAGGFWLTRRSTPSAADVVAWTEAALARHDLQTIRRRADQLVARDRASPEGLWLQARLAEHLGRDEAAVRSYRAIPPEAGELAVQARCRSGEIALFRLRRLSIAESLFQQACDLQPQTPIAHDRLAYLLGLQSRFWEAVPHRLHETQTTPFTAAELYLLSLGDRALDDPQTIAEYWKADPTDPGNQLAWARVAFEQGDSQTAAELWASISPVGPHVAETLSRASVLIDPLQEPAAWKQWDSAAQSITDHPGVWSARGRFAEAQQDWTTAVACYSASARLDAERAQTFYRLGQLLARFGSEQQAEPYLQRARQLEAYHKAAELAYRVGEEQHLVLAIEAAEQCGLMIEAWSWAALRARQFPKDAAVAAERRLHDQRPSETARRSGPEWNPALQFESTLPQPSHSSSSVAETPALSAAAVPFAFVEATGSQAVDQLYLNGGDPTQGLVHMYEITGGGVAVLDYDLDLWPDLYFPQGSDGPPTAAATHFDRLWRRGPRGDATDVTSQAQLKEAGFSVGASVGDLDGDGFPDLYVTNAGQNRLFRNCGDGTFVDITESAGLIDDDYSASSVWADFSGDGLPDLYVVNYLAGDDLWTRVCGGDDGVPRSCLPQSFPAARDRFWLNQGDGRFTDESMRSGVAALAGKGLGVIAADFAERGQLDLYIVNDVGPNFLLENTSAERPSVPVFRDVGLLAGVALDGEGRSLSAMGVTTGDINGDGLLDVFVTNFEQEPSSLYLQTGSLQFIDASQASGVVVSPLNRVGWGTQMLDVDLDGWLDLAVTNGHVNNLADLGKPYRMMSQLFRNVGQGQLRQETHTQAAYFHQPVLGRGMVRWDGNRDGLEDLVVTHLDRPPAILWNQTETRHHGVGFFLTARSTERDAIGAIIHVTSAGRSQVRQLTAGDGNQSCNQRRVVFGLGSAGQIDSLTIRWPNGTSQSLGSLPADADYRVVEGGAAVLVSRWANHRP
jgi:tetratricopeptide (TPR) repeat protein